MRLLNEILALLWFSKQQLLGITETTFKVGELTYKLFDLGGPILSEWENWIHDCFENVMSLVSLSEYDQMLHEDESHWHGGTSINHFATRFLLMTALLLELYARHIDPVRPNKYVILASIVSFLFDCF
jgi:hypothetical protein